MVRKTKGKSSSIENSNRKYNKSYQFFLNELFRDITEGGIIVELMRAAENIKDIRTMLESLSPSIEFTEQEELEHLVKMESTILYAFNLMGAQLREALKLFDQFRRQGIYVEFKRRSDEKTKNILIKLEETVDKYKLPGNILHDLLIPLRNIVFHYDCIKAGEWLKDNMMAERRKKPIVRNLSPSKFSFGIGSDYNNYIFESRIFFPSIRISNIGSYLIKIGDYQNYFLRFTKSLSFFLLKRADIRKREDGWYMKYFYGYRD